MYPARWLSLLAALAFVGRAPAAADTEAVAAAATRQACAKTVEAELKFVEVIAKGAESTIAQAPRRPAGLLQPDRQARADWVNRVVLDGEKFRYEDNTPGQIGLNGSRPRLSALWVFNGSDDILFTPGDRARHMQPMARLIRGAGRSKRPPPDLPIQATFRGAGADDGVFVFADLRPTGRRLSIDTAACLEFDVRPGKEKSRAALLATHYWLDPARGYVVRRTRKERRGGIVEQLDIRYRRDDTCGWVPASWVTTVSAADGRPLIITNVKVANLRINVPQPAAEFDVRFPAGTLIGLRGPNAGEQPRLFRVEADGTMREVSRDELLAPAQGTPDEAPSHDGGSAIVGWLAGGLAVVLLVAYYLLRLRRSGAGLQRRAREGSG